MNYFSSLSPVNVKNLKRKTRLSKPMKEFWKWNQITRRPKMQYIIFVVWQKMPKTLELILSKFFLYLFSLFSQVNIYIFFSLSFLKTIRSFKADKEMMFRFKEFIQLEKAKKEAEARRASFSPGNRMSHSRYWYYL